MCRTDGDGRCVEMMSSSSPCFNARTVVVIAMDGIGSVSRVRGMKRERTRTVGCTQAKSKRAKLGQRRCGQVGWRWQVVFLGLDGMSMLGQRGFWSGLEPPVNSPLGKPQISRTAGLSHWADHCL